MAYRDIRYRVWIKDDQKMSFVDELIWSEDGETRWVKVGDRLFDPTRVELMEYTGKRDKNGDLVFEGDKLKNFDGRICAVTWFGHGGRWDTTGLNQVGQPFGFDVLAGTHEIEIVGNIYENGETV
jgi:uncharacterized phage protein (TIGR01671 family)